MRSADLGYESTTQYLFAMCELIIRETGLLPHVNAGIMTEDEIDAFRRVSVSQGIMLESVSQTALRARRSASRFAG